MLTGGCPLAQAEKAICERFAVVCEDSADTDGASPFQVAREAAGIDCGLCIEDADKDPAGGPVYCHKEVATPVLICHLGQIFHVHMEVSGLAGLEAAVPGLRWVFFGFPQIAHSEAVRRHRSRPERETFGFRNSCTTATRSSRDINSVLRKATAS